MTPPRDHEVRETHGERYDNDGGKHVGAGEQDVIDGDHDLLGLESKLEGDLFQRIDGGAVDIGLAGFA